MVPERFFTSTVVVDRSTQSLPKSCAIRAEDGPGNAEGSVKRLNEPEDSVSVS